MAIISHDPTLSAAFSASNDIDGGTEDVLLQIGGSMTPIVFGAGGSTGVTNFGSPISGNPAARRLVRPGTSGLFGKCVQLTNKSPLFRGAVIAELQIELDSTGDTGPRTECVMVQGDNFRFIARSVDVEEAY